MNDQEKRIKEIIIFLGKEAESCRWYADGIKLGKVKKANSTAQELYDKADYFISVMNDIAELQVKYLKDKDRLTQIDEKK